MKGPFMRQTNRHLLLSSVALAACLVFGSVAGAATPDAKPAEEKAATFGARDVKSFAGAFLAARTADVDHDYPTAIALYRKALDFEPANLEIRERLMISLLLNGDFADGLKEAEALKSDTAVERVTKIVRGLDALRSAKYDSARKILAYEGPNDLDRLTHLLLSGWADVGAGKGKKAIATINGLKGPAWFKVFTDYHLGAMAIVAGDTSTA